MLRTANQRLAALVLVGGVVALVTLLLLFSTMPFLDSDLLWVWSFANDLAIQQLIPQEHFDTDPFLVRFSSGASAMVIASLLSYGLGLLLALRVLLEGWREVRRRCLRFTLHRFVAALILLSGAISCGALLWYMDFCNLDLILAWANIKFVVNSQYYLSSVVDLDRFADAQIRAANVTLAALALSYVLSLALAVGTLWRQANANSRRLSYNGTTT